MLDGIHIPAVPAISCRPTQYATQPIKIQPLSVAATATAQSAACLQINPGYQLAASTAAGII